MKKFTLLLCVFVVSVMMPLVMWADVTYPYVKGNLTINVDGTALTITSSTTAGDLATFMSSGDTDDQTVIDAMKLCTSLTLIGKFSTEDLDAIKNPDNNNTDFCFSSVDMSRAKFPMLDNGTYSCYSSDDAIPSPPSDGKYAVGGTCYQSVQKWNFYEIEATPQLEALEVFRPELCYLDLVDVLNEGNFKMKHALFFKVVDVDAEGYPTYIRVDESTLTRGFYSFKSGWNTGNMVNEGKKINIAKDAIIGVEDGTYKYFHVERIYVWEPYNSNTEGELVNNYYRNLSEAKPAASNSGNIVVGGSLYLYNNGNRTELLEENDWLKIRFKRWKNYIKIVILPGDIYNTDLADKWGNATDLWNECTIEEIRSGSIVATITSEKKAIINFREGSTEYNRMAGIVVLDNLVNPANVKSIFVGAVDGLNSSTGIYTVNGAFSYSTINSESGNVKVLDLKNATSDVTKDNLKELRKETIEYIILPAKRTKEFVCDSTIYYTGDANPKTKNIRDLKAIISSDEDTLVAHVIVPGSLAGARYYATSGKMNVIGENESFMPTPMGLKSVTLSGNLNANDISTKNEDKGLSGEMHTIESMDLEKAYFPNNDHMNFLEAGFQGGHNDNCHLSKISLPIDERMKHIPADCFRNLKSLDSLCIPFNYQYLHNGALYDSNVEHLTTTDSIGGAVIDNGSLTYTLSANLLEIGDAPTPKLNGDGIPQSVETYVFPKENGVLEIYSLATKVPKCYRYSFSYDLTFGYGGQDQTKVYGRNRYFNNGEGKKSFVVLRYPSKEVFERRRKKGKPVELQEYDGADAVDKGYALMEQKYTDTTKVYTKKDQTGAVDANGDPLLWPARTEGNRSHNQATVGALWDDWGKSYNGENGSEINDGEGGISSGSRSMTRRKDPADVYEIDLSVGTSTTGVKTNAYTFEPTEDWTRMLQYYDLSMIYDTITYKNIVVHYTATTNDFYVYADEVYNLPSNQHEKVISLNKTSIDEFTIYNSNSTANYWNGDHSKTIKIDSIYFTTDGANPKKLYLSMTNGKTASVVRNRVGENYTFQPIGNVRNMFQYKPLSLPNDGKTYKKLVVEFAQPVPKGFNIHAYGERGEFYSLEGKDNTHKYEIPLNGNQIEDFTIFNWDDAYWTEDLLRTTRPDTIRKVEIVRAYFTTDNYEVIAAANSKYRHDKVEGNDNTFDLVDYIGWHQIVLTQAVYYEPVEKKEDEKVKREYEKTGFCTFCIPYDMTYSQVVKMLGVPASTDKVKNYADNSVDPVTADILPDIRQLISVERTKGTGNANNQVLFRLTTNLAANANDVKYLNFVDSSGVTVPRLKSAKERYKVDDKGNVSTSDYVIDKDPRCIIGGRPYIINAYKRKGEEVENRNLGLFIMKRYTDELNDSASCVNNGKDYYEQLDTYEESNSVISMRKDTLHTMRFAKPYELHKVQAVSGDKDNTGPLEYELTKLTKSGGTETSRYYYTMVGQFWEQDIPQYAIYMTRKGEWKRYVNTSLGFKWDPYKCVIMATPEVIGMDYVTTTAIDSTLIPADEATKQLIKDEKIINKKEEFINPDEPEAPTVYKEKFNHFGGGFRDIKNCYFPMNYKGTLDWIPAPMTLTFFGRDDIDFDKPTVHKPQASTRYVFVLDDEIMDFGDEVTGVKAIDTLDGVPQLNNSSKVYSLSGQYMGNTTNGLPKGVYIVGGRKIVVD